jgi:hypothetical protein
MSTIRATYVQHGSSAVPNITLNASGQVIVASGIVSSGTFAAPTGSAAAPGVYFVGDTNTGLYSPGADQVAISTNGTQRLLIKDASQDTLRVSGVNAVVTADAIGSSYPGFRLASNGSILAGFDGDSGNSASLQTYGAQPLIFGTNSAERLRITSAGLVGVGTSSPSNDLDVLKTASGSTTTARIGATATSGANNATLILNNGGTGNATLRFDYEGSTNRASIGVLASDQKLTFGTAGSTAMTIDASQRVGVGTTSPGVTLDVAGDIRVGTGNNLYFNAASGFSPRISNGGNQNEFSFFTNNTERVRIDSSGRLGIGTSTPVSGAQLTVAGAALAVTGQNLDHSANSIRIGQEGSGAAQIRCYGPNTSTNGSLTFKMSRSDGTNSQDVVIDGSGRLGIGTTSPGAALEVINTTGKISARATTGVSSLALQIYNNGTDSYIDSTAYGAGSGGGIAFRRNGTVEMGRFDTSGRLLVGTSSYSGNAKLVVSGRADGAPLGVAALQSDTASPASGDAVGSLIFNTNGCTSSNAAASITANRDGGTWTNDSSMPGRLVFSTTADGASSPTERMRISQNGSVMFGKTDTNQSAGMGAFFVTGNSTQLGLVLDTATTSFTPLTIYNLNATNNGFRFYVKQDGGIGNFQANNVNLSDRNAKKDISPAADTWDCIKEWEIVNYRYKDQPDDADLNLGVIAQQVAESCPEVITVFEEAKDDQPEKLGVKEQQMYWMAIKALQEAQTRIETLEAEVAALKGA